MQDKNCLIDDPELLLLENYYRKAAFLSVLFCTGAVIICGVSLPLLYNHVQYVHTVLQDETQFCMSKSSDLWRLYSRIRGNWETAGRIRSARSTGGVWSFGKFVPDWGALLYDDVDVSSAAGEQEALILPPGGEQAGVPSPPAVIPPSFPKQNRRGRNSLEFAESEDDIDPLNGFVQSFGQEFANFEEPFPRFPVPNQLPQGGGEGQCCTCQRGEAGSPGNEGRPGNDGRDGRPGEMGRQGLDAPPGSVQPDQPQCNTCPDGIPGPPGFAGQPGPLGRPGDDGLDGGGIGQGSPGPLGTPGFKGTPGPQGGPGLSGEPGRLQPGSDAPPGFPGESGFPGSPGNDGLPGSDGQSRGGGTPGLPGDNGDPGPDGTPGFPGNDGPPGPRGLPGSCDSCPPARLATGY